VYNYCRKLLVLPFLPGDVIAATFAYLSVQASELRLQELKEYNTETWMDNELWPPTSWSCHRQSVRTNNDTELWHARLNRRTSAGNLGIYQQAERLYQELKLIQLTMKTMSDRKVGWRCTKGEQLCINARIERYYDEYDAGTWSAAKLLSTCSHIYASSLGH